MNKTLIVILTIAATIIVLIFLFKWNIEYDKKQEITKNRQQGVSDSDYLASQEWIKNNLTIYT